MEKSQFQILFLFWFSTLNSFSVQYEKFTCVVSESLL